MSGYKIVFFVSNVAVIDSYCEYITYFLCWCLITRASTSYAKMLTLLESRLERLRRGREFCTALSLSRQNVAQKFIMRRSGEAKFPRRFVIKVATMNFCRSRKVGQNCAKVVNRYAIFEAHCKNIQVIFTDGK